MRGKVEGPSVEEDNQSTKLHLHPSSSSISSSPSHEFSFTVSLHHEEAPPPLASVDLSPADDIFFHGHLLPLHLLSHVPLSSSPRSSINSLDSFTLPIRELLQDPVPHPTRAQTSSNKDQISAKAHADEPDRNPRPKSFSFFGLSSRWSTNSRGKSDREQRDNQKKKIIHVLKRYMRMVRPLILSFRERRREKLRPIGQPYSLSSGDLMSSSNRVACGMRRWRDFSAPASIRTSPTNSGLLTPDGAVRTMSDSTMEELQNAIQAAIAHCKSSIAMEDKDRLQG